MKDCTFTVEVNGKRVTYDYDGIRAFLMDSKNLAAVAPTFYGGQPAGESKPSAPKKLMQEENVALTNLTRKELNEVSLPSPLSPLREGVPKTSMYKTAAEARAALSTIRSQYGDEAAKLRRILDEARRRVLVAQSEGNKEGEAQLDADFLRAKEQFSRVLEKYRNISIRMIAPGGLADITWKPMKVLEQTYEFQGQKKLTGIDVGGNLRPDVTEKIQVAIDYFRLIVGDHPALRGLVVGMRYFENQPKQRAFFKEDGPIRPYVELPKNGLEAKTITHELGHWLESMSPLIQKQVGQFLKRRAAGELPRRLSEITGNSDYGDHEMAIKDQFIDPYIGRYYRPWKTGAPLSWDMTKGSEVISMGVQYMYENPARFAQEDPDMFDFIYDVLRAPSQSDEEGDILGLGYI